MTELCALAEKYGVDKCPKIFHSYTPVYHEILNPIRDNIKTLVEIGIGNVPLMSPIVGKTYKPGASLRMWRDYLSNAHIIGCDILPEVLFSDEPRISTYYADQSSENSLISFADNFKNADIILDDGSHIEEHMILSFKTLWKTINSDGLYIIEDIKLRSLKRFETLPETLGITDAKLVYSHPGKNDWDSFIVFKKESF
jgi:hypothetical protein